jgi:hypothetical protein
MTLLGRFMNKLITGLAIFIVVTATFFAMASEEDVDTTAHEIVIVTKDDYISVDEVLTIQGDTNESYDELTVWIQSGANDVQITINDVAPDSISQNENEYICNTSSQGITKEDTVTVTISYNIAKTDDFSKKVIRDTTSVSVVFDQEEIYTGTNLVAETSFSLQLYQPTEPTFNYLYTVFIILLVILVLVFAGIAFRKKKTVKIQKTGGESEELLTTKKALLMELLKDIEKQHRAKQISDDTYHKLKERYKQEAVEAMKQLEDIKSKVK